MSMKMTTDDGAPTGMGCATAVHAHRRRMRNRVVSAAEELTVGSSFQIAPRLRTNLHYHYDTVVIGKMDLHLILHIASHDNPFAHSVETVIACDNCGILTIR